MKPAYPCVVQKDRADNAAAALLTVARRFGVRVAADYVRKVMAAHPNPISALAIVETAAKIGIRAVGVRGDWNGLLKATLPIIAHLQQAEGPVFVVVHAIADGEVTVADPEVGVVQMTAAEFQAASTGIFITVERIAEFVFQRPSGYMWLQLRSFWAEHQRSLIIGTMAAVLLLFSSWAAYQGGPWFATLCGLNFCGLAISFLLSEFTLRGAGGAIVEKVCVLASSKAGCTATLFGPQSKLWGRVAYAVLALGFYFSVQILMIVLGRAALAVVLSGYLVAVGFAVYLTYQQVRVLKAWCVWCMLLHGMNLAIGGLSTVLLLGTGFGPEDLLWAFLAVPLLAGVVLWYDHEATFKTLTATNRELGRLRGNPVIVSALHRAHPRVDVARGNGFEWIYGFPQAAVKLIIVSNPLCVYCATMDQMLRQVVSRGVPIQWSVRFLNGRLPERCPDLLGSRQKGNPVELSLLLATIGVSLGAESFWKALGTVYQAQQEFSGKTPEEAMKVLGVSPEGLAKGWAEGFRLLQQDEEVCKKNRILSTPRVFLDERPLPEWTSPHQVVNLVQGFVMAAVSALRQAGAANSTSPGVSPPLNEGANAPHHVGAKA